MMLSNKNYVAKVLLAADVFVSALCFRDPSVTISAEVGLAMKRPKPPRWAIVLNFLLDRIEKDHCANAIKHDILRAQIAIEYLEH
jgi:hypothetical protein